MKAHNTRISNHAECEPEIDWIDMTQHNRQKTMMGIDTHHLLLVLLMKSIGTANGHRTTKDAVAAFQTVVYEMGIPKQISSDDQGSFKFKPFLQFSLEHNTNTTLVHDLLPVLSVPIGTVTTNNPIDLHGLINYQQTLRVYQYTNKYGTNITKLRMTTEIQTYVRFMLDRHIEHE